VISLEKQALRSRRLDAMLTVSNPARPRQLLVFRMSGHRQQQHALIALSEVRVAGVVALGSHDDRGWFVVVVQCPSMIAQLRARRIVLAIDRRATCVDTSRPARRRERVEPPEARPGPTA
jgi:hypothetical protein